jgi:hypothetical protein
LVLISKEIVGLESRIREEIIKFLKIVEDSIDGMDNERKQTIL